MTHYDNSGSEDGQLRSPGDDNLISDEDTDSLEIKPPQINVAHLRDSRGGNGRRSKDGKSSNRDERIHSKDSNRYREAHSHHHSLGRDRERDHERDSKVAVSERDRRSDPERIRESSYHKRPNVSDDIDRYAQHQRIPYDHSQQREEYLLKMNINEKRYQKHYDCGVSDNDGGNVRVHYHQQTAPYQHHLQRSRHDFYERNQNYHHNSGEYHHKLGNNQTKRHQTYSNKHDHYHHENNVRIAEKEQRRKYHYEQQQQQQQQQHQHQKSQQKDPESLEQDLRSRLLSKRYKYVKGGTEEDDRYKSIRNDDDRRTDDDEEDNDNDRQLERNSEEEEMSSKTERRKMRRVKHKNRSENVIEVLDSPDDASSAAAAAHHQRRKHKKKNKIREIDGDGNVDDNVNVNVNVDVDASSTERKRKIPDDPELLARRAKILAAEREREIRKESAREELAERREKKRERGEKQVINALSPTSVAASVTAGLAVIKRKSKEDDWEAPEKLKRLKRTKKSSKGNNQENIIKSDEDETSSDESDSTTDSEASKSDGAISSYDDSGSSVVSITKSIESSSNYRRKKKSKKTKVALSTAKNSDLKYEVDDDDDDDDLKVSFPENLSEEDDELSKSSAKRNQKKKKRDIKHSRHSDEDVEMIEVGESKKKRSTTLHNRSDSSRSSNKSVSSISPSPPKRLKVNEPRSSRSLSLSDSIHSHSRSPSQARSLSRSRSRSRSRLRSKSRSRSTSSTPDHAHRRSKSRNSDSDNESTKKDYKNDAEEILERPEKETMLERENTKDIEILPLCDEKGTPLPNYFPGVQGCRSVEEFQCLNRIEEGTYGVVYRAKDKRTNEVVALKRLKMEKEKDGFPITSLREINTLLKGQHPNIVTVREIVVGSNMDKIYIVMDYVEHDLKSLMETMKNRKQSFLPGEVKCLIQQLLRAVGHLHDNWILHRDLKTSNLLLSHKGILKVGDFGLAREYGSPLKKYTSLVVTLWYRAPELLLCSPEYSTPIDIWSVGCIFGEFLQMAPLFPGKSEIDELNRIYKELGTPNEKIWPGYKDLPAVKNLLSQNASQFAEYPVSNLRKHFIDKTSELGISLLQGILTYDPKQRLTADAALKHPYFKELPLPIDPSMFPTWPAKSELGARKALASSPKPPSGGSQFKQLGRDDIPAVSAAGGGVNGPKKIVSGIITGNKKTAANTGFVLNAGIDQRQLAMGPGFNLKF